MKSKQEKNIINKGKMKKMAKRQTNNGITLIALVITIIVLIILAGVSIATLTEKNGIIVKSEEAVDKYNIASEKEYLEQNILLYQTNDKTNSDNIEKLGEELKTQNLYNGDNWNMVFTDKENYGTDWNYIAKGTQTKDYGKIKYNWIINYNTSEIVQLEDGKYDKLDYKDSVAIIDDLPLNIDASNLKSGNWDGITKHGDVKYIKEKMALNFDGNNDYLELKKEDADFSNGFTFEIYMNLERLTYDNGCGRNGLGLFCKIRDLYQSGVAYSMRFYFADDKGLAKFYSSSSYAGIGKNLSTNDGGAVCTDKLIEEIISTNTNVYLTIVYEVNATTVDNKKVDKLTLYIDGTEYGYSYYGSDSYQLGCNSWNNFENSFFIGACPFYGTGNVYYLNGLVYTTRLYTKSLTIDQVKQNYDQTLKYREKISTMNNE